MSAVVCINDGDTHNGPVEAGRRSYPMVIEEYALRPDSGGAGRQRGGLGIRKRGPPAGRHGVQRPHRAHPAARPGVCSAAGTRCRTASLPSAPTARSRSSRTARSPRCGSAPAKPTSCESGGGGGYGNPLERPPERVRQDVLEGYVSAAAAHDAYGVVLHEGTLALDEAATARRRQELAANG